MNSRARWLSQGLLLLSIMLVPHGRAGVRAAPGDPPPAQPNTPPTGVKTVVDDGLVYLADGQKIGLLRRTDVVTVALRPSGAAADAALARLIGPGGPLRDFVEAQALAPDLRVLRNPAAAQATDAPGLQSAAAQMQAAIVRAGRSPDVRWAGSAYVNAETGTSQIAAAEVVVALRPGQNAARFFGSDARWAGFRPLPGTAEQFVGTVAAGGGDAAVGLALELAADRRVGWATPNFYQGLTKADLNDPLVAQQWHLENTGQNGGTPDADVDAAAAWAVTPGGSRDVVVAVVDDGMEYTHPDLAPNLFVNEGEIAGNSLDDDGNGWVDDRNGWDFTANDPMPGASSSNDAHATSVGGVIAAAGDNGIGVAGIAYQSRLLPVRVFGDTGFATSDANIAAAIYYAAGRTADGVGTWRAADIMNLSWGGGAASTVLTEAFTWASSSGRGGKGTLAYAATGNNYLSTISYPARLAGTLGGMIAVGASTNLEVRASYSNYGAQLDFVAPSSGPTSGGTYGIVTVDRVGTNGYAGGDYTSGGEFGGTSSATPLSAGIGALILALDPDLTAAQVRGLMRNTTDYIGPQSYESGFNTQYGYGRVNAAAAVRGVGVAEIQVLDGGRTVATGGSFGGFSALVDQTQTRSFRVRNQGTADLSLAGLSVSPGPFSLAAGFSDTLLSVGEAATFAVAFTPSGGGPAGGTVSFTSDDADESAFVISLAGTGIVTSISGTVFEDWDGDGTYDADEAGLPDWQLYLDQNGNGALDRSTASAAPSAPIPDNTAAGVTSTIAVAGLTGTVGDLDVELQIAHSYVGDLEVTLLGPTGVTVPLIARRGGIGDNFTATVLDDEAVTPISAIASGGAPFTGRFRPESPLSALDGIDPNGDWQLRVADRSAVASGTLVSWSIGISTEPIAGTDASGNYAFFSVEPGAYAVRPVPPSGWNVLSPAGGGYAVTIVDVNTTVPGRDFGVALQNAIYGQQFNDQDGDGQRDAGEAGQRGWQMFLDRTGDGQWDPDDVATAISGQAIPDNTAAGITSDLVVTGVSGPIRDLNVRLTIAHPFVMDLEVSLVSPTGFTVPLITKRGSSGDNFTDTVLDDEAETSIVGIGSSGAPFTGRFRPEAPLSALDGMEPNGVWQLRVADRATADHGTLVSWALIFENEARIETPDSGKFRFADLAPDTYVLRQTPRAGWRPTHPAAGSYTISLAAGATSTGNEFGTAVDVTPPTALIGPVVPDPRVSAVGSIAIMFAEPVTGFDLADLALTRDGQPVALAGATLTGVGASYAVSNLSAMTADVGAYTLTLRATGAGVADLAQNVLVTDASDSWTMIEGTEVWLPLLAHPEP